MGDDRMDLPFKPLRQEIEEMLAQGAHLVLATSAGDRVTARTMSYVNIGLDIYFQTGRGSTKYAQISANPRVALCLGNLQIEGEAEVLGHPLAEANRPFASSTGRNIHPPTSGIPTARTRSSSASGPYSALCGSTPTAGRAGSFWTWRRGGRSGDYR